ncbi:integral membrane protein Pth11-like, putative [Trichophyton benhamiae CBS 112371]|uniref:Integral membrane protein Pth11-like, putative n=1 Tax=Arthroderma benhamiae (strain ATCC MYA-4681 / CBS 112371) TaxID=663331 RepID=D4AWN1_ARTBC|nr:integral membrane protein Pth11-like, putative [Trichophyton benhamiae CBS 112371]EFE32412.1 integral membrane protein Pth11-like, putative [Trichophyton benhamiae CBS 112371]
MATQWLGAIPPPPGVTPNIIDPPSQRSGNIALHTVCLTLATAAVAMRVYTRTIVTRTKMGADDCVDSRIFRVDDKMALSNIKQWFTFAQYVYLILTATIKLTFLFFYRRVFSPQTLSNILITFGIVFVAVTHVAILFATIFSCSPIARAWNIAIPGRCINPTILPYLSGALSSTTDLYVLILPIYPVWNLHMKLRRKIKLLGVFGLGIFAVAASLVRLAETPVLQSNPDATWNISRLAVWAVIEANVGIFCGCLLLLPAFLDRHLPKSIASSIKGLFSTSNSRRLEKGGSSDASSKQYSWPNSTHSHKVSVSTSSKRHSYLELNPSNSVHDAV